MDRQKKAYLPVVQALHSRKIKANFFSLYKKKMSSLREAKSLLLDAEKKEGKKRKEWRRRFNNIVRTGRRQRDIDVFIRELKGGDGDNTKEKKTNIYGR